MTGFETKSVLCASTFGFHRMVYSDWGPRQAAETVVCVHGLTRNGRDFDFVAANLAQQGYRVICPDIVGRGRSENLAPGGVYGIPQYVADMTVLMAAEGLESVAWLGTSMGGLIGMAVAAMANSPIQSLMLNDVGPFIPKASLERIGDYVGIAWRFDSFDTALAHVKKAYEPFGLTREEDWVELAQNSLREETDPETGARSWVNNYDTRIADPFKDQEVGDIDLWLVWDTIVCPTWVIRGALSDLLLPDTAVEMQQRGPKASVIEVPNTGHAPALMDAQQAASVREWLTKTVGGPQ